MALSEEAQRLLQQLAAPDAILELDIRTALNAFIQKGGTPEQVQHAAAMSGDGARMKAAAMRARITALKRTRIEGEGEGAARPRALLLAVRPRALLIGAHPCPPFRRAVR